MIIKIVNIRTAEIIVEKEYDDLKTAVEEWRANLREADLHGANLRRADLRRANLYGADLYGADLYGADLREADLREADLRRADLYGADLYGADLREADLREANLREANLREADLHEADLNGADLHGANLRELYVQIKGSKHWFVGFGDKIRIRCEEHTVAEWQNQYEDIGLKNGYTLEEINEYKSYVDFYAAALAGKK